MATLHPAPAFGAERAERRFFFIMAAALTATPVAFDASHVARLREVGLDDQEISDVLHAADVVVRIGCQTTDESGRRYLDWQVDDPFEQPIEMVRRVRDELEERVRGLLAELEVPMREHVAEPVVGSPLARRRWMPARRPSLLSH